MKKIKREKLMSFLTGASAFLMVVGALFRLQHYPYGGEIFSLGIIFYIFATTVEINYLKKLIKKVRHTQAEGK